MKYFPIKTLIIFLALMPAVYVTGVFLLEQHVQTQYASDIENLYIGDTQPLLEGRVRLKDAVSTNVEAYLRGRKLNPLGIKADVLVLSGNQVMIYPAFPDSDAEVLNPLPREQIASNNFRLMNEGLSVRVDVSLARGSFLDIGIIG